jgi:hypothetical protein
MVPPKEKFALILDPNGSFLPKLDLIWNISVGIWMHVIEENKQMELNHDHLILKTR